MKKFNNKQTFKEMQDCLDSDDELPTTYTEVPELPAYLDDDRFDEIGDLIEFRWLNNSQPKIYPHTQYQDYNPALDEIAPETHENKITPSLLPLTTDSSTSGTLSKKGIFEEWNSTLISSIQTELQTNKEKSDISKIPLAADGHIKVKEFVNNGDSTSESEQSEREIPEREATPLIHPPINAGRTLLRKGILKEQDILCIKSFAAQITDGSTLLWFIDFLATKDLQSEHSFPQSCLVPYQYSHQHSSPVCLQTVSDSSKINAKFELIVI